MRVELLLAVILALGLPGLTDALCDLKSEDNAVCQKLEDFKYIDSKNVTILKASVQEKILRSNSLKILSPSMKTLDLSDGEIQIIEPGTFSRMMELRDLKLSDNSIVHLKESALNGLHKLKNFDLRRNNIYQLPSALKKLEKLKNLEISGNPLVCNCAALRVRDELLAKGVKISKKVLCRTPSQFNGVSFVIPDAEVICMFEQQDAEMQADQAAGSGDAADDSSGDYEDVTEVLGVFAPVDYPETTPEIITDDLIVPTISRHSHKDDFEFAASGDDDEDALIVEGSGATEPDEEGSGEEGSGADGIWQPINPSDFSDGENESKPPSSTEEPSSTTRSWFDVFWNTLGGEDTSTQSSKPEPEESLTDEEFIPISQEETTVDFNRGGFFPVNNGSVVEEEVVTKQTVILDGAVSPSGNSDSVTKSDKMIEDFAPAEKDEKATTDDTVEASTRQATKSMGSYVVLAALLGVLAALIGFAAYKSSLCRKKSNEDPERGSELKDIRKSLLDTNSANQPKIASNGNKESAPLVEPQDNWAGHQELRQWGDNGQSKPVPIDNGNIYTPPPVGESDPVKPPRKSVPPQEDTNRHEDEKITQSPVSSFVPIPKVHGDQQNSVTPPNSPANVNEFRSSSPPLSPNTQRVKITLQDNPDSIPKTPILITRTKPGVNLVKSP